MSLPFKFIQNLVAGASGPIGTVNRTVGHWTAGSGTYVPSEPDYQFVILGDGTLVQHLSVNDKGQHTWGRNGGALGWSWAAMGFNRGRNGERLGLAYPTAPQIKTAAVLNACLAGIFGIDIRGTVPGPEYKREGAGTANDRLTPTGRTIQIPTIADHAWYAVADQYPESRWDVGSQCKGKEAHMARYWAEFRSQLVLERATIINTGSNPLKGLLK